MRYENTSFAKSTISKHWKTLLMLLPILLVTLWPSGGLRAQTGHNITLTWSAPATGGTPTSYNVKRGIAAGAEATIASVPASALTYVDSSGTGGVTYFYVVTAVNSGGESTASNEVTAAFLAVAPGAPSGLAAVSK